MKHLVWLLLLLICCEQGVEPQGQKVVPNETPPQPLVPATPREQASTAEILALKAVREQEAAQRKQEEEKAAAARPRDLRQMNREAQAEAVRDYRTQLGIEPPVLEPFPQSGPKEIKRPPPRVQPGLRTRANPKPKSPPKKKAQPRPGGGRLFAPRTRVSGKQVLPGGAFWRAQLVGNASVSALFSPTVFAKIFDRSGNLIGTGIGKANLHRGMKDRVMITMGRVYLDDGRELAGPLTAFDLDLSMGLLGRVERRSLRKFALAVVETFLGALSLEVETGGESFGNVMKFQLADRLLEQAGNRVQELEMDRIVHLERDTVFWVSATRETSLQEGQGYDAEASSLTTLARDAFQSRQFADQRRQAINQAYQGLQKKLQDLPGQRR